MLRHRLVLLLLLPVLLGPWPVEAEGEVPLGMRSLEAAAALESLTGPDLAEREAAAGQLVAIARTAPEACARWLLWHAYRSDDPERTFRLAGAIERICREHLYRGGSGALGARLQRVETNGKVGFLVLGVLDQREVQESERRQGDSLQVGDLLVGFDGIEFGQGTGPRELAGLVARHQAGDQVVAAVIRGGVDLDLRLRLPSLSSLRPNDHPPAVVRSPHEDQDEFVARTIRRLRDELR